MRTFVEKKIVLGLFVCMNLTARSQNEGTTPFRSAIHCLVAKEFLQYTRASKLTFGHLLDDKSYPEEKMLYIVFYPHPSSSNGSIFTIFVTDHDGHGTFNIQNNARFRLSKDGNNKVSFVDPPLGGTWTQEHLVSAIIQINRQPKTIIPIESLLGADTSVTCEAYTDPQPRPAIK